MLQESVDALFDNGRRGRVITSQINDLTIRYVKRKQEDLTKFTW